MKRENYFDNAATTQPDPRVVEAMLPFLTDHFGNSESIHAWGLKACEAVEKAREHIAKLIKVDPNQVTFTSGATEGCNWAVNKCCQNGIRSPFEHGAVRTPGDAIGMPVLENDGFTLIKPSEQYEWALIMLVNNETGAILETDIGAKKVFSDITQAVGKIPVDANQYDMATMSSHKLYGPKGAGAVYFKDPSCACAFMAGGGQEKGLRSGTVNVPAIVGMGEAARIAQDEQERNYAHATVLKNIMQEELSCTDTFTFNDALHQSPFVMSVTVKNIMGETLVVDCDQHGFGISSGSACSSKGGGPSPIHLALGKSRFQASSTIRISFAHYNTKESAQALGQTIKKIVEKHLG